MPRSDPEKVKSYLELIAGERELERLRDTLTAGAGPGAEAAETPAGQAARGGLEAVLRGRPPTGEQQAGLEAIIIPELRPAIDIVGGRYEVEHRLWTHLAGDPDIRQRIEAAIPSVGRLELPGNAHYPYGGTAFVVGDGLVMTNRHVAAIFAAGLGRNVAFKRGHKAGVDFLRERGGGEADVLLVRRVVMIHPYWDMAILAVDNLPADRKPLRLATLDVSDLRRREIAVIGYPAFDPRNDAQEQDALFDKEYGVKRLQPGQLHGAAETESYGKIVRAAAHDCSTLGGNSGSCVIDLATGDILALHFGGRYRDKNYAVPAFELARDGRVVDSGVQFSSAPAGGTPAGGTLSWAGWWGKSELVDAAAADDEGPAAAAGGLEAMVEPWHDTELRTRTGYDENFLGIRVPMPVPADPGVLAATRQGGTVLHYQNFSIMMHRTRRLALVAASNIATDPALRKPDPRKTYTRKALGGLGDSDQERWFLDSRLDPGLQLPDVFFTRDRGAFDKGHIVRREDVAWGKTYEALRRANGDSYHVTNCSPQTKEYNQSSQGVRNWGDLENHVLAAAAEERLAQFAGPVLAPSDTMFVGAGGGRTKIRARIPGRFWKVIVAKVQDGLAAFGFVLEQDLSDVEFEFVVSDEFVPHMVALADIEAMAGIRFPAVVAQADQYDTVRGAELSMRAGASRRRRR